MFDRTTALSAVQASCFGQWHSAVIVGTHKLGKTFFMRHLHESARETRTNLVIGAVDVRLLLGDTEPDADRAMAFLRSMCEEIREGLRPVIAAEHGVARKWTALCAVADSSFANVADVERRRQEQIQKLEMLEHIQVALAGGGAPAQFCDMTILLKRLKKLDLRVVLFIDDFDLLLRAKGVTDRLFEFLRGASSAGLLTAIVTSPHQLMHPDLHPEEGARRYRISLVNHFRPQPLDPFDVDEAFQFLDWPRLEPKAAPALAPEEKSYLFSLGGPSPHFLERARGHFLTEGRPATAQKRRAFEARLLEAFMPEFATLWDRCGADRRRTLEALVRGDAVDPFLVHTLEREGYLVERGGRHELFSTLFAAFLRSAFVA